MPLTRRQALGLAASGLGALSASSLAGCATPGTVSPNSGPPIPPASGPIRLTYWAWLKDLQKVADIWNAQNPNVQVDAVWIPPGNSGGYAKIFAALAAGGGPDIAQIELRSIPELMLVNGLIDLKRYGAAEHESKFNATLWSQVSYVDGVYGIPQDSGPMAMYYRPDLFEAAGANTPPATWDEWAELGAELRRTQAYIDAFPISDAAFFMAMATQAGATWFRIDGDGWVISLTDEATLSVARFFDQAIDDGIVTTSYSHFTPGWFAAAAGNQVASIIGASWGDALLQGVSGGEGKWRVAPMPRWSGGYPSTFLGGSTTAMLAQCRHPKEALDFAVWMTTSQAGIDALIENSGIGWSVNDDYIGAARQQDSAWFGGQSYNTEVFVPAALGQNPDWQWGPATQQSINILSDQFRKKASGQTLVDGLARAESTIIDAFRAKGLSVTKGAA